MVYPISAAGMEYGSMEEMIRHAGASELEMAEYISRREPYEVPGAVPIGEVKLLAPIPHPAQDVICLGINYMAHAKEAARFQKESFEQKAQAIYFSKRVNRAVDPEGRFLPTKTSQNSLTTRPSWPSSSERTRRTCPRNGCRSTCSAIRS